MRLDTGLQPDVTAAVRRFWDSEPCGSELSDASDEITYFGELTQRRYQLEPHIPELVKFSRWKDQEVLEIGCGPGTDGEQFARAGARYTAVDLSEQSLSLARRRFQLLELDGTFRCVDATALPFPDASFDLVYSHGVIHHIPRADRVVAEIRRVLRPGGQALVMVYNRSSLNYRFTISVLRRLGALVLLLPSGVRVAGLITRERDDVLIEHRNLLRLYGARYLTDLQLFLNHNTDGPGNPFSRVYDRDEALELFADFAKVGMTIRYLNLRAYPPVLRTLIPPHLERRLGWHRYIRATA